MKEVSLLIRGTCQQFKFTLPYTKSQVKTVQITFWQKDHAGSEDCALPITKVLTDCVWTANSKECIVTLNQVETLAFTDQQKGWVQFRGVTTDDFAFGSRKQIFSVYPVKDETILQ